VSEWSLNTAFRWETARFQLGYRPFVGAIQVTAQGRPLPLTGRDPKQPLTKPDQESLMRPLADGRCTWNSHMKSSPLKPPMR